MNLSFPYKRFLILSLIGGLVTSPLLTSCGGAGDGPVAGIGGTGITQGEITAFGSVFVNGVEFETDNSEFDVDGDTSLGQDALEIGMVVTITGDTNLDEVTGTATLVKYDDEIQGPVSGVLQSGEGLRTLTIFDQSVVIDEFSTRFANTTFIDIQPDDILEISGFRSSSAEIRATFVKQTGVFATGAEVELKGAVSQLTDTSFKISSFTISYNHNGTLQNDDFVEVKGELQSSTTIIAREVELEDEGFEENTEISLQGVISEFDSNSNFKVASQPVDASGIPSLAITLENGLNVEVEGKIVNGVLVATEIELRQGSVEIQATVDNVIGNEIEFKFLPGSQSIFVLTDNQTQFEDEVTSLANFSVANLQAGNFVKIDAFEVDDLIVASRVKRLALTAINEDTEIQGSVSAYTANASITILGLTFSLGQGEQYDPPGLDGTIKVGSIIELVDEEPDGIIDKVESE